VSERALSVVPGDEQAPVRRLADAPLALRAQDVHVTYRVYEQRKATARDLWARPFKGRPYREVHAVRGVSVDVHEGEVLGLVGPNGSGKSSFLGAIAGLLPVERGSVEARATPMLLGVGVALRPRLSGRHNVYLGGLALGLNRRTIDERFSEIVAWAGLEDFIDMPMRAYSSGMKARLQFAIATVAEPEILLVDEALAVGDRRFKNRSRRRLEGIAEHAGAVIIVSHNLNEIERLCSRVVWLEAGQVVMDADPITVLRAYEESQDDA
jgi:teichoic acid transport system ATP-binding protein